MSIIYSILSQIKKTNYIVIFLLNKMTTAVDDFLDNIQNMDKQTYMNYVTM